MEMPQRSFGGKWIVFSLKGGLVCMRMKELKVSSALLVSLSSSSQVLSKEEPQFFSILKVFFVVRDPKRGFFYQLSTNHWCSHSMLSTASPSLLPCSDYSEVGPPMPCQTAPLVPSFLHRHNPSRFSTTDLTLCDNLSSSSKLFHLSPSFSFRNVLSEGDISVLWNATSSPQNQPNGLIISLCYLEMCPHSKFMG